jgi:diguanylate cyclase (GGDEF)-like protein
LKPARIPLPRALSRVTLPPWLPATPRRLGFVLLTALALGDLLVVHQNPLLGFFLLLVSAALSVVARFIARDMAARAAADAQDQLRTASEGFLLDKETALPNRQHLIDQLAREIARAQRYSHDVTLTVVEVARLRELQTAWGPDTGTRAIAHVAETLRRVTRTSDFLARIDDAHFAIVLMQCNTAQAAAFAERVALAVSNRPLRSTTTMKVPLYVGVECASLQYEPAKFRGPLDFLSAAGGDLAPVVEGRRTGSGSRPSADAQSLRRQLVRDYYPEGKMDDFAAAYRSEREQTRRRAI